MPTQRHAFFLQLSCWVIALAGTAAQAAPNCELNGQSINLGSNRSLQGKTGLMRCTDRDSGLLVREQALKNGQAVGLVRIFEAGSLLREQRLNLNGKLQGRAREFSASGQMLRDAVYNNGTLVDLERRFHPNGQLLRAAVYSRTGVELAAVDFTPRGQLSALRCSDKPVLAPTFDDAQACGFVDGPSQVALFSDHGQMRERLRFAAGKRVGLETLYSNGKLKQQEELTDTSRVERSFAADGVQRHELLWAMQDGTEWRKRELEFSSSGKLVRQRLWAQGELASEMRYYPSGQLCRKAEYEGSDTTRVLVVSEYFDNGVLSSDGVFSNTHRYVPTPVGLHHQFDQNGALTRESVYDARGRSIFERNFKKSEPASAKTAPHKFLTD